MQRLSVVIATFEREALVDRVLAAYEAQTTEAFDVVVAVNADQRDVRELERVCDGRAQLVRGGQPGVSASRNAGWRAAREDLILFTGDDMVPAPDVVERHLALHAAHPEPEAGGLGHVRWARELRHTPFMDWLETGPQFDFSTIRGTQAAWWHLYACNASVKRALLERVGGYDEAFRWGYEDLDLGLRLDAHGFRLVYDPACEVEHAHEPTLDAWKQRMRVVADAERQFVAKHPQADAYFHDRFAAAIAQPPASTRGVKLAGLVPRGLPVLGARVHFSADRWFTQQLAKPFLDAWDAPR